MTEAEQERAAAVAWLRSKAKTCRDLAAMNLPAFSPTLARHNAKEYERLADDLERGDHLGGDT